MEVPAQRNMHGITFMSCLTMLPCVASIGILPRMGHAHAHPGVPNVTLSWHEQQLDHFDYAERRTFRQRVFTFDGYWTKTADAPILFYCGNEANVELYVNATGLMWERGHGLGALLVFAEHRFYGQSLPFGSDSFDAEHLRWLTLEQALADYATLIYDIKTRLGVPDAPVIALGGSYGGMLAAWLRMHYPAAVVGAIAASAPVLAFDGLLSHKWDNNAYWRVVTADASPAAGSDEACTPGVRATWPALFALGRTAEGRARLQSIFKLCAPLSAASVSDLASWLLNLWDTLAMGNFPYRSNYLVFQQTQDPSVTLPPWPFRVACAAYAGASARGPAEDLLARMAAAAAVLYNASGRETCYALPDDPNYDGIWDYQWCTQRLPQETYFTIDGREDMFWPRAANASAVAEHCESKYGVARKGFWIAATSEFGATSSAANIVFSNGEYDPWRSGGVLTNLSSTVLAIDIAQGAHHLDLMFTDPADPPSVRWARDFEVAAMERWVAEARAARVTGGAR